VPETNILFRQWRNPHDGGPRWITLPGAVCLMVQNVCLWAISCLLLGMKYTFDNPSGEVLRFERCQHGFPRTKRGLQQFQEYESKGVYPEYPDPYFIRLLNGKKWWEWTVNEYAARYGTAEWPGWVQLEQDFASDPAGLEAIARRVGTRTGHLMPDHRLLPPDYCI